VLNDPIEYSMVKSINEFGHMTKKKTVAEFVENNATLDLLKEIGVDYAQVGSIALPIPFEEFSVHANRTFNNRVMQPKSGKWCQDATLFAMRNKPA